MSNNRIFTGVKVGEPQGRNVNLAGNMFKRAPIFTHVSSDKQESSPFANYNCRSAESLFSSESQQSIQEDRLSIDAVRQIIKEQLMKGKGEEDPNKKLVLTLQAQLKDIKQKLNESEAESAQKLQELRQAIKVEMKEQVAKMGREVDEEITNRLRLFFQKANVELKKDILNSAADEFLSMRYGQDLEIRLQTIDQTLNSVNNLIKSKEISTQELQKKISSINLNENLQNKLSKMEREADGLKKSITEYISRTKQLQEWKSNELNKSMDESLIEIRQKIEKIKEEQTFLLKPVKLFESKSSVYDNTLNKLQNKLEQTERNCEQVKGQLIELHRKIISQQLFKQDSSRTSEQLKVLTQSDNFDSSLVIANNSSVFRQFGSQKKSSSNDNTEINDFANIAASTSTEYQQLKKSIYQVDSEGHLMDGERRYILTDDGAMIKLQGQQIKALLQSKVIEVIDA